MVGARLISSKIRWILPKSIKETVDLPDFCKESVPQIQILCTFQARVTRTWRETRAPAHLARNPRTWRETRAPGEKPAHLARNPHVRAPARPRRDRHVPRTLAQARELYFLDKRIHNRALRRLSSALHDVCGARGHGQSQRVFCRETLCIRKG